MANVDESVFGTRRTGWKANWTDGRTHTVTIVHTCGSFKISTQNLSNIVLLIILFCIFFNLSSDPCTTQAAGGN